MPGGDRTGPTGAGPMTGRAAGICAGNAIPGFSTAPGGRGPGRGQGRGRGMGGGGFGRRRRLGQAGVGAVQAGPGPMTQPVVDSTIDPPTVSLPHYALKRKKIEPTYPQSSPVNSPMNPETMLTISAPRTAHQ